MRRKIIISGTLIFISAVVIAFANRRSILTMLNKEQKEETAVYNPPPVKKKYNEALVKDLDQILKVFDERSHAYTLAGTINTVDKADTTEKNGDLSFEACKDGNDFYYKMGKTEALNEGGTYLNINDETKKVFITEKRQDNTFKMIDANQLKSVLQTEEYDLVSKNTGALKTISLINEHHFTCKEYAITFDTTSKKLVNIFYRLAYFREPMNKNKEKLINIRLSVCDTTANIGLYNSKNKIITGSGKLTDKYSGYKLVRL